MAAGATEPGLLGFCELCTARRALFEDDGCSERGLWQVDSGTRPVQTVEAETTAVTETAIVNAGSGRTQDDTAEGDQDAGAAQHLHRLAQ